MTKLRVLDLFSGIGGFSLGLERAGGFETVAFCEIEEYPRRVLAKHWPKVPIYHDVRNLTADTLRRDGIAVDVICGGFPCQDISFAGKGAGLAGERSGLWREYARLVRELRPRFVIVENVAALLGRGLADVLGDLAALGYDAEWHCIPASAVGAPHRRDRLWIVAYPGGEQHEGDCTAFRRALAAQLHAANTSPLLGPALKRSEPHGDHQRAEAVADTTSDGRQPRRARDGAQGKGGRKSRGSSVGAKSLADADGQRLSDGRQAGQPPSPRETVGGVAFPEFERCGSAWWFVEPDVGRVADDVPRRVDRLRCLGNAVVNEIPFRIGQAILQAEGMTA